jgi:RNA polymerase sigma-70 factor (ECF subfamily)
MNQFPPNPQEATRDQAWTGLMLRAQSGDQRAYAELLAQILPFLRGLARRQRHSPDQVEDVVQDVLVTLHRIRHTYDPSRPFTRWLATIAQRRGIDLLRKQIRQGRHEIWDEEAYETFADPRATREQEAHDATAGLNTAMRTLSKGQREAIELVKIQELSLAEAAAVSGKSVTALKVTIHRAVKLLREHLVKR